MSRDVPGLSTAHLDCARCLLEMRDDIEDKSPYGITGAESKAVTSSVPTNKAATQVDTSRNISDVIAAVPKVRRPSRPLPLHYEAAR
jgi:hypothetical protein